MKKASIQNIFAADILGTFTLCLSPSYNLKEQH